MKMARRGMRMIAMALAALAASVPGHAAERPARVVSMNVCTDQLAMLIAAPGQLVSVSRLAVDPGSSAMVDEARQYPLNDALAEEVFLMRPDLVVTGTFTTQLTDSLLERLGVRVERFAPETSFDDVRANILRMGELLGNGDRAAELLGDLDAGLQRLAAEAPPRRTVATYASNSYSAGRGSLSEAIIEAAGFENLGSRLGIRGAGRLPLELLVLSLPDILTNDTPLYDAPALAQENFVHPAYEAVRRRTEIATIPPANWVCGGPFNLAAATILQQAAVRSDMTGKRARP